MVDMADMADMVSCTSSEERVACRACASALGLEIVVASVNHQHSRYVSRRLALGRAVRRLRPKLRAGENNAVLRSSH